MRIGRVRQDAEGTRADCQSVGERGGERPRAARTGDVYFHTHRPAGRFRTSARGPISAPAGGPRADFGARGRRKTVREGARPTMNPGWLGSFSSACAPRRLRLSDGHAAHGGRLRLSSRTRLAPRGRANMRLLRESNSPPTASFCAARTAQPRGCCPRHPWVMPAARWTFSASIRGRGMPSTSKNFRRSETEFVCSFYYMVSECVVT